MAFALLTHVAASLAGTGGTLTTGSVDTTGSNLITPVVSDYSGNGARPFSDNKVNTYTSRITKSGGNSQTTIFECQNPAVGSGHTFTYGDVVANYSTIFVTAWSGAAASSQFDVSNSNSSTASSSVQPGSVTPNNANSLLIFAWGSETSTSSTASVNGGFTISDQLAPVGGLTEGGGQAYLIQTSIAAANPTASGMTGAADLSAAIAVYKPAAGGGGSTPIHRLTCLGVG